MNKNLVVVAVLSLLISACGNDEEPKTQTGESAMQESTSPAESMTTPPPMGGETMDEATGGDVPSMAEEAPPAMEEPMGAEEPAPMEETAAAQADPGKKAYDMICFACHAQGIAGAPMLGDKAAWEPRIAKGIDTLVNNAINGFQGATGVMPPKGGLPSMTDEEVRAAVSYMVDQAK